MLGISEIEEACEAKGITLVIHPTIRRVVQRYPEGFYVGARCFLRGETNGLFFLPLNSRGHVRLRFSQRRSPGGHPILRVDPVSPGGLNQIRRAERQRDFS
jgi:hypothetical protein